MTLRFRNTLGGALEPFEPIDPSNVRIYSCGPTVYAPAHVGNFRSFLFADLARRYLAWKGYRVTWVMNITDVDDKIIRDASAAGITIGELTAVHTATFLAELGRLRVAMPDVLPRATDHIPDMARLIATLLERGHAYRTDDGSIFFRIASWPAYGRWPASMLAAAGGGAGGGGRVQQGRCPRFRFLEGAAGGRAELVDRDR